MALPSPEIVCRVSYHAGQSSRHIVLPIDLREDHANFAKMLPAISRGAKGEKTDKNLWPSPDGNLNGDKQVWISAQSRPGKITPQSADGEEGFHQDIRTKSGPAR